MDRKCPGSGRGKALAPIFTKKAGALMSHPNNSSRSRGNASHQSQSTSSQMRPAAAKVQNYQDSNQQQNHGRFQRSNSVSHNPQSQGAPQSHPQPGAWSQSARYSQGPYASLGGPAAPPGPAGDYFPSPAHPQFMPYPQYPPQENPCSYQPPGGSSRQYYPQQPPPQPSYNHPMPPAGLPQYDVPVPYQQQLHGMPQYGGMMGRSGGGGGGGGEGSNYFSQQQPREAPQGMDDQSSVHNAKDIGDAASIGQEFEVKRKAQPDCSLHFISASIQGAKHWSRYVDKLPIMYELFGVLNSAVTTGGDGYSCSKEFLLKDDKDTMRCVFYQIDRTLPKMVRGHWYRCVGHLQQGKLNCVGIREATDTEKKMFRTLISASDKAMRDWVANSKET